MNTVIINFTCIFTWRQFYNTAGILDWGARLCNYGKKCFTWGKSFRILFPNCMIVWRCLILLLLNIIVVIVIVIVIFISNTRYHMVFPWAEQRTYVQNDLILQQLHVFLWCFFIWNTGYHIVFQWAAQHNYLQNVIDNLSHYNNCMCWWFLFKRRVMICCCPELWKVTICRMLSTKQ